jgi:anti-sigma regulatory factor (Ser/Thr protein kinase)
MPPRSPQSERIGVGSSLTLDPQPSAVRKARAFVAKYCEAHGYPSDVCETAVLLTSEAVTNAFTHGRSEARIAVAQVGDGLRIEVGDDNSRHPERASADVDALNGRGMTILELLATRWGIRDEAYGKTVWFEVGTTLRPT